MREEVCEDGLRGRGRREEDKFVACHGRRMSARAASVKFSLTITLLCTVMMIVTAKGFYGAIV